MIATESHWSNGIALSFQPFFVCFPHHCVLLLILVTVPQCFWILFDIIKRVLFLSKTFQKNLYVTIPTTKLFGFSVRDLSPRPKSRIKKSWRHPCFFLGPACGWGSLDLVSWGEMFRLDPTFLKASGCIILFKPMAGKRSSEHKHVVFVHITLGITWNHVRISDCIVYFCVDIPLNTRIRWKRMLWPCDRRGE